MSDFIEFLEYKALNVKYQNSKLHAQLIDSMFADVSNQDQIRNVCAKVSVDLVERMDRLTTSLDISKREFIEYALIEALEAAEDVLEERGINAWIAKMQDQADEAARQREASK